MVAVGWPSGHAQRAAEPADEAIAGPRKLRLLHSLFALEALDCLTVFVLAAQPFGLRQPGGVQTTGDGRLQARIGRGWECAVQGSVLSCVPGSQAVCSRSASAWADVALVLALVRFAWRSAMRCRMAGLRITSSPYGLFVAIAAMRGECVIIGFNTAGIPFTGAQNMGARIRTVATLNRKLVAMECR